MLLCAVMYEYIVTITQRSNEEKCAQVISQLPRYTLYYSNRTRV